MIPSFSCLDTGTSIKRGGDKLALPGEQCNYKERYNLELYTYIKSS